LAPAFRSASRLEIYCGLTPSRPLSPQEERQRRKAEQEARALLEWRAEMLESLKRCRNRNWKVYHQSKSWILRFGLGNERGCLLAEAADIAEETAEQVDEAIEKLSALDWDGWLKFYRSRSQRAA
jgi:hypothetical protein